VASVLGSPGQGNYAAANAFIDALAEYRRGLSLPALAVNWGPFGGLGMGATYSAARNNASGIGVISLESGMQILAELLTNSDESCVVAAPFDWERLLARFEPGDPPPLLRTLAEKLGDSAHGSHRPHAPSFAATWKAAAPDRRNSMMVAHVREQVAAVMGLGSPRQLDSRQGFSSLGVDSLMAVELKARLQASMGLTLPNTLAFEYPNIEALAGFLARELAPPAHANGNGNGTSNGHTNKTTQPDEEEMESLSEDEIAALLAGKLEALSKSAGC